MSRVARYHADRTNQKLYFARLACQQAEQTEHIQQAQAYREAAVFHLHGNAPKQSCHQQAEHNQHHGHFDQGEPVVRTKFPGHHRLPSRQTGPLLP